VIVYTRTHLRYIAHALASVGSTGANFAAKASDQTPLTTARVTLI